MLLKLLRHLVRNMNKIMGILLVTMMERKTSMNSKMTEMKQVTVRKTIFSQLQKMQSRLGPRRLA